MDGCRRKGPCTFRQISFGFANRCRWVIASTIGRSAGSAADRRSSRRSPPAKLPIPMNGYPFTSTSTHSGSVHQKKQAGPSTGSGHSCVQRRLKCPRTEQELDDVAFVWLKPIELNGWNGADVQTVDVGGVDEFPLKLRVLGDDAADERGANPPEHFFLRTADHTHKREHELGVCQCRLGRVAMNHRWPDVAATLFFHQTRPEASRRVLNARFLQARLNRIPNRSRRTRNGK